MQTLHFNYELQIAILHYNIYFDTLVLSYIIEKYYQYLDYINMKALRVGEIFLLSRCWIV